MRVYAMGRLLQLIIVREREREREHAASGNRGWLSVAFWAHRQFDSQIFAASAANALSKHSAQNAVQIFTITLHKRWAGTGSGRLPPLPCLGTHLSYLRHKSDCDCDSEPQLVVLLLLLVVFSLFFFVSLSEAI